MDVTSLSTQIQAAMIRFSSIQNRCQSEHTPFLDETLAELSNSLEELRVVNEELQHQNIRLAEAAEKVDEERRRFRELFDFAPGAYFVTDPSGMIIDANDAAAELTGRKVTLLLGKPLSLMVHLPDRAAFREQVADAFVDDKVKEFTTVLLPGEEARGIPVRVRCVPSFTRRGEPQEIRWLVLDQSERNMMLLENKRLNNDLWRRVAERTSALTRENDILRAQLAVALAKLAASGCETPGAVDLGALPGRSAGSGDRGDTPGPRAHA